MTKPQSPFPRDAISTAPGFFPGSRTLLRSVHNKRHCYIDLLSTANCCWQLFDSWGMSEQNGASSQVSVLSTAPLSHTSELVQSAVSSASVKSMPPDGVDSSVNPAAGYCKARSTTPGGTATTPITGKVEIPKLSAATTELLARVTGSMKGDVKKGDGGFEPFPRWSSSSPLDAGPNGRSNDNMNNSAFLELTPTSFASPSFTTSRSTAEAVPTKIERTKTVADVMDLVPKPAEPASANPQSQSQVTTPGTPGTTSTKQQKAAAPRTGKPAANGAKRTTRKRRRGDDDEEEIIRAGDSSSEESDVTPTATQTKSGRQVNRPSLYVPPVASPPVASSRNTAIAFPATPDSNPATTPGTMARKRKRVVRKGKEVNVNCMHCQRGHSPLNNTIVFCDWCNKAWHQLCHDPSISDEVVQVKDKEWLCKLCKPEPQSTLKPRGVQNSHYHMQSQIMRMPLEVPPLEIGGAGFSEEDRRGYLSSLSHATLVELLVTLSDRNPDMPIYPANLKALPLSQFPSQSTALTAVTVPANSTESPATADATQKGNSGAAENGISGNEKDHSMTTEPFQAAVNDASANGKQSDDEDSEYEVFEDHRLYPRAGNGLHLSLNPDDLDILRDDPACPTFSYSMHGPAKARVEANDAAPLWGST